MDADPRGLGSCFAVSISYESSFEVLDCADYTALAAAISGMDYSTGGPKRCSSASALTESRSTANSRVVRSHTGGYSARLNWASQRAAPAITRDNNALACTSRWSITEPKTACARCTATEIGSSKHVLPVFSI
jgi:hypothetical protein